VTSAVFQRLAAADWSPEFYLDALSGGARTSDADFVAFSAPELNHVDGQRRSRAALYPARAAHALSPGAAGFHRTARSASLHGRLRARDRRLRPGARTPQACTARARPTVEIRAATAIRADAFIRAILRGERTIRPSMEAASV
jgi:hypothetical protein